ncbi:MAG: RNA polymerase sigma-70 factor [Bacteroidota bacterium]
MINYDLIKLITNNNDIKAYRKFFEIYSPELYKIAFNYTRSEEDAKEIVADTFIKVWEKRKLLKEVKDIDAYLYVLVRNLSLDFLRKASSKQKFLKLDETDLQKYKKTITTPESIYLNTELKTILNEALIQLPERQFLAFQLLRVENKSYKEVAKELGISVSAVEKLISKAVNKLSKVLTEYMFKDAPTKRNNKEVVHLISYILLLSITYL